MRPAISRLSRDLSEASVKPHQAGKAYMSDETVVALETIWMLPCFHTFCFQCLKRTSEVTQEKKGEKVTCPLCGKKFAITEDALTGVQKVFFLIEEEVLESNTTLQMKSATIVCDVCSASDECKAGQITLSTI